MTKIVLDVKIYKTLARAQAHAKSVFQDAVGMSTLSFLVLHSVCEHPDYPVSMHVQNLAFPVANRTYAFTRLKRGKLIEQWMPDDANKDDRQTFYRATLSGKRRLEEMQPRIAESVESLSNHEAFQDLAALFMPSRGRRKST